MNPRASKSRTPPPTPPAPSAGLHELRDSAKRRPLVSVLLVLLVVALIATAAWVVFLPQLSGQSHWRLAKQSIEAGDFASARDHLRECLKAWPKSAETHFLLARTARRAGDFNTAHEHLQRAEALGWVEGQVHLELMLMGIQQGEFATGAETTLRNYLQAGQHPDEELIYEALAKGYMHSYRLFDARDLLEAWSKAYPQQWQAYFWHGTVLERLGKAEGEKARADYLRVLELRPQQLEAQLRLARVLLAIGQDYAKAAEQFTAYLKEDPTSPEAQHGLGNCQRALGRPEQARHTLRRLVGGQPTYVPGLVALAVLEADQDHLPAALELLQRAERMEPNEIDVVSHLALVLRRLSKRTEAEGYETRTRELETHLRELDQATRSVATKPNDPEPRWKAGSILLKVGKEQEGLRWLDTALRVDPDHKPTHLALAEHFAKSSDANRRRLAEEHRLKGQ